MCARQKRLVGIFGETLTERALGPTIQKIWLKVKLNEKQPGPKGTRLFFVEIAF